MAASSPRSAARSLSWGPSASIHKLNERVHIADLAPLATAYRRILERLLLSRA
jgi:acetylornithine deacetylase/succinyl-diaminopimelate desuccinylase-like protein